MKKHEKDFILSNEEKSLKDEIKEISDIFTFGYSNFRIKSLAQKIKSENLKVKPKTINY